MLEEKREKIRQIENKTGEIFSKFLEPNQYTLCSLLFALLCLFSLRNLNLVLGLIFFSLAALLDFVDGAVARKTKKATKKGAYLDTICDRYVEGIIFFGFLFLPWPKIIFPAHFWIFLAFFGSLMTTYAKAAAKEKEIIQEELRKGFIGRGERMILLFLVFFFGIFNLSLAFYFLITLAILTNLTALQRFSLVLKKV